MRTKNFGSLAELVELSRKEALDWTDQEDKGVWPEPWFRGHARVTDKLVPSLYRVRGLPYSLDHLDQVFRQEFARRARPYVGDLLARPESDWDWYFTMRHYGAPTRLLDWSESAATALYFAISGSTDGQPCVWMLNPYGLNNAVAGVGDHLLAPGLHPADDYLPTLEPGYAMPPERPVALLPSLTTRRIAAQRGVFTIHGSDRRPLEDYKEIHDHLIRFDLDDDAGQGLMNELWMVGVKESTLFPELGGVTREISTELTGRSIVRE